MTFSISDIKKALMKRRREISVSSDEDQVDESLFVDREDKARWEKLSELEKEREIFERMEARGIALAQQEILQQLAERNEKRITETRDSPKRRRTSDSGGDAEFYRSNEINRDSRVIEKKNDKKAILSFDTVFGANSGSSSLSSSCETSPKQSKVMKKEVGSVADLRKVRLSRHKLSLLVHAPFFDSTVIGCFIRIGQGMMSGSESKYRIWKIIGVEETNKVYDLEGKRTNKCIRCQLGQSERVFRMQFVSNSEFEKVEFDEWFAATKTHGTIPTADVTERKQADVTKALNHKYSDKEIDAMIQEKSKFQNITRNFAMTKAGLSKEKELAQQRGDMKKAERVQKRIDEIEQNADELDKERSKSIRAIAFINHRNRNQMKDQVLSGNLKIEENPQDDPFTRKRGGMRVVSGSKSKVSTSSSTSNMTGASEKLSPIVNHTQSPPIGSKSRENKPSMSNLHNFDLDIDINKLNNFSTVPSLLNWEPR
uniref:Plus3 domain-containing protein n=1 Tax=Caenorhabditis tropicalis TaxID=1561998 RepID=A0A1I7TNY2_9PELO